MISFNRKDQLNRKILTRALGTIPDGYSSFYVPSSELFLDFIKSGIAYGSMPDQQSSEPLERGEIEELAPGHREQVPLYWHCWNLDSDLLRNLSGQLIKGFAIMHKHL